MMFSLLSGLIEALHDRRRRWMDGWIPHVVGLSVPRARTLDVQLATTTIKHAAVPGVFCSLGRYFVHT